MAADTSYFEICFSLVGDHLGEGIDSCVRAGRAAQPNAADSELRQRRHAATSVVRSYAAIECIANQLRFELYGRQQPGRHSVTVDPSDVALQELLASWSTGRLSVDKRLRHVFRAAGYSFDADLAAQIVDVATLRHQLAHGPTGTFEFVMTESPLEAYSEYAYKSKGYGRLRFSDIRALLYADARKAVETAVSVAQAAAGDFSIALSTMSYELSDPVVAFYQTDPTAVTALMARIDVAKDA